MADTAIFDVDGTLVNTNYQHALAWYRAFRRFDITLPIWRIHRGIGLGGDTFVPEIAGRTVEQEHAEDLREAWEGEFLDLIDGKSLADAWTTSDDVAKSKPEPDLVATALAKVEGSSAVMFGDSVYDAQAAPN